jgi:hypothetical protein
MNNNLEFENEDPSPDSIEDNHPRTNYGEGYGGKETLEEVAHKMLVDYGIKSIGQSIGVLTVKKLMVNMAKWQAERMYSEEEVIEFGEMIAWNMVGKTITESFIRTVSKELFQQFKKK